ncbi:MULTISPECIES: nuclease-related domain-containing protein [Mesobacillus]|uniref:Ribosomal protein L37AE/L43A n=1 Tax=Mesobacillus stamsii TaxID=225347 RepID=A0ABU0FVA2_9BACI|nr:MULTISPECIES: nuclease-related domain-containing protein [Mesobacillus]MDQ0413852.1 ribosomal protein L37AE/L43A [Mesobacillus stamsii]
MIEKERTYPIRLLMYEALLERIIPNHPKTAFIEQDYRARRAGYRGELQTDYRLSFLPEKGFHIFRDLRLQDEKWHFQIDTLLLTLQYILLIETKAHSGTLFFDKHSEQMIQTKNDQEKSYDNPINQVRMQAWHLKRWLQNHKFRVPPIYQLVAISNASTIIKVSDHSLNNLIVKGDVLLSRVHPFDERTTTPIFTDKEARKLAKSLLKNHSPHHPDILKQYSLSADDLQKGVQCPACLSYGMNREKWIWRCPVCEHKSKTAHHKTVKEFFLLISPTIKNQTCREFCPGVSSKTIKDLLLSLSLPHTGTNKGRIYHMPPDIEIFFDSVKESHATRNSRTNTKANHHTNPR